MPDVPTLRLTGRLVTADGVVPQAAVVVADEQIRYAGAAADLPAHLAVVPTPPRWPAGVTLLPGLVDVHCHGAAGAELGEVDGEPAARHHHRAGTTTLVASLASRRPAATVEALTACAPLVAAGLVAGVHLEGPFLAPVRAGAQDPAALRAADPGLLRGWLDVAAGLGVPVRQLTFAPEVDPHGLLLDVLAEHGVLPALGHSDADAGAFRAALGLAARHTGGRRPLVTHLGNAMAPFHHRAPGPFGAALAVAARGGCVVEVVGDGVHVAAETVRLVFDIVGADGVALVTDALAGCGLPDGRHTLAGQPVVVRDGIARLRDSETIAGGTATLLEVVRRTVAAGVDEVAAVTAATRTPARTLGLDAGELTAGSRADVLTVDADGCPVLVLRAGQPVG